MDTKKIIDEIFMCDACADLSRLNHLHILGNKPRITTIPDNCEWCDYSLESSDSIYYYNSPSESKILCDSCGERIKTNNDDNDIIFCYKII